MPLSTKQQGFTLLELVIAMSIFALLGVASWRLFDGVVRAEISSSTHERNMRTLQRAVAVIERDVLQATSVPLLPQQGLLHVQRGNWRNPLDHSRSEVQNVTYRLDNGTLWRESHAPDHSIVHRQRLLNDVVDLQWRLYAQHTVWYVERPPRRPMQPPMALELTFSTVQFGQIRRVLLLPGSAL